MTQLQFTRIAALTALGLLIGGAAHAQVMSMPKPVDGVTVTVPRVVQTYRDGIMDEAISMSARVPYGDLNLKTPQGSAELDDRIKKAAAYVCTSLTRLYPDGSPDDVGCQKAAIAGAGPQIIKAKAEH